jgi:hypothetical protein
MICVGVMPVTLDFNSKISLVEVQYVELHVEFDSGSKWG